VVHRQLTGSWTEWLKWLLRRRRHLVVRGESMLPTLAPGDHIFLNPGAYQGGAPTVGDVVVARHPFERDRILVKRVTSVDGRGRCFLQGDNPHASTDSHRLAPLIPELILGRVTRVLP
jgi:nickel-type superoxide dismutase maturation protease